MSFEDAHSVVKDLVDQFKTNEKYFLSNAYQEAEVRKDFIDRFFIALGWDVLHQSQKNPYEQEVKVERGVDVSGAQKRADYSFTLAPNFRDPKFYAEAKKPSKSLYNSDYYFQTIRYGWHKTTPLAILTDFEELHILDCRFSPDFDTILNRQVKKFHYSDYFDADKFAEIYWLFSREAVINNSLEKYAETLPKPKGKAYQKALFAYEKHLTIDDAFLEEIDGIREKLAKAFKKNDDSLNSEELTEVTQRTIDRLVFIRFLEDKLIEQVHYVNTFGEKGNAWEDFIAICAKLDAKYNGIVFKRSFIDDSRFKGPIDTEFHEICQNTCHLNSRFLYNEIPIHILGSIYERFLGKVVHATGKRVTIEEKPEVRKAGGVYYTPKYIVDYIVQTTIGKLIEDKTPVQISKMRFADIACGSGSFLISVFDCLLMYHNKYYQEHPDHAKRDGCLFKGDLWVLSIKQKQNILRNNIYGMDIDSQAVEVTQLSLSLKMLEDETTATANEMQVLFHEKILPDMSKNIVCGNSLIRTDILDEDLFSGEGQEEKKLNPMNYENAFPVIMENGGFDSIVGNPPYIRIQLLNESSPLSVRYFKEHYQAAAKGNYDIYCLFIEKAHKVLKSTGQMGYILPHKFFQSDFGVGIRDYIAKTQSITEIIDFNVHQIFKGATTYTCLLFLTKQSRKTFNYIITKQVEYAEGVLDDIRKNKASDKFDILECKQPDSSNKWFFSNRNINAVLNKIKVERPTLNEITRKIFTGLQTSADKIYLLELTYEDSKFYYCHSKLHGHDVKLEKGIAKKFLLGKDIHRYELPVPKHVVIFPYTIKDNKAELMKSLFIKQNFPSAWEYIYDNKKTLEDRENGKMKGEKFYAYIYPKNLSEFEIEKIMMPHVSNKCELTFDSTAQLYHTTNVYSFIFNKTLKESPLYFLGILNSKLLWFFINNTGTKLRGGYINFKPIYINEFPIQLINFQSEVETGKHDRMQTLVKQILLDKGQLLRAKTDKDIAYYNNKYSALDRQINSLVYEIYGLSEEEIKIVEDR